MTGFVLGAGLLTDNGCRRQRIGDYYSGLEASPASGCLVGTADRGDHLDLAIVRNLVV